MYAFIAAALAAPVEVTPDEVAEIPPRRLYRYRDRPPLVIVEGFDPVPERRFWCENPARLQWNDELRASVDEIR